MPMGTENFGTHPERKCSRFPHKKRSSQTN